MIIKQVHIGASESVQVILIYYCVIRLKTETTIDHENCAHRIDSNTISSRSKNNKKISSIA